MNYSNRYVVIMAGGVGSRVWPLSRKNTPKQFQDVLGTGRSMIQETFDRFEGFCPVENIFVVTTKAYVAQVKEQLPHLEDEQILGEPMGRNTAACIAYATYKIHERNPNATMVIAPSDHMIIHTHKFIKKIELATERATKEDILITLGIQPTRPDTGYGYIQFLENEEKEIFKVKNFTEKPAHDLAVGFVESGEYLWNAGIFIWSVQSIMSAFEAQLQDMNTLFKAGKGIYFTKGEAAFLEKTYSQCKNISIDYGIMEHAENVYVIPCNFGWTDLGTWKSCYEVSEKDTKENVLFGEVMTYDSKNCLIKAPQDKLVVVHGLDGYVVVDHENVLLICKKEEEQKVKNFVADVKSKKWEKYV